MRRVISIDLGVRGCGVAVFIDRTLDGCAYVKNPVRAGSGPAECAQAAHALGLWLHDRYKAPVETLVRMEWPRVYQRGGGRTKGDPNDLRGLWTVGGAIAALMPDWEYSSIEPALWKGQLPHDAVEARVLSRLDEKERRTLNRACDMAGKTLSHNIVDAVGIGLHVLGRFDKTRIIHRKDETNDHP